MKKEIEMIVGEIQFLFLFQFLIAWNFMQKK